MNIFARRLYGCSSVRIQSGNIIHEITSWAATNDEKAKNLLAMLHIPSKEDLVQAVFPQHDQTFTFKLFQCVLNSNSDTCIEDAGAMIVDGAV